MAGRSQAGEPAMAVAEPPGAAEKSWAERRAVAGAEPPGAVAEEAEPPDAVAEGSRRAGVGQ